MTENNINDDPGGLAAEYVLGTLDASQRRACEERMKTDRLLARAVHDFEQDLAPLQETVVSVMPPNDNLVAIMERIGDGAQPKKTGRASFDPLAILERRLRRWRHFGLSASAVAASLAVFIAVQKFYPSPNIFGQGTYIAVLQSGDKSPHFVASVDLVRGVVDIVRIGDPAMVGKAYELWAVGGGRDRPESLGLVKKASLPVKRLENRADNSLDKTVFAISLEPEGGSPTGQPTGPVLFTGKLHLAR